MGQKTKASRKHRFSKRVRANREKVPSQALAVPDAVKALKGFDATKFDQTVEIVFHLGIDPKQADQAIRGSVALPKGIGKSKRVIAFCKGDAVKQALDAGAVKAGRLGGGPRSAVPRPRHRGVGAIGDVRCRRGSCDVCRTAHV